MQVEVRGEGSVAARNVYCIGRNYVEHAKELQNEVPDQPVVFLKTTAALRPLEQGPLAFAGETFHHEAELVLLIGKDVALGAAAGWDAVRAIGLGLDLTRREVQSQLKAKGLPWTISKSFAGSGVLTPFLPRAQFKDLESLRFTFDVNGETRQRGDSALTIFKVPRILTYLAALNALAPGDLVYTGTPAGVGPVRKGDRLKLAFVEPQAAFEGVL